jgi:hypothetical protein
MEQTQNTLLGSVAQVKTCTNPKRYDGEWNEDLQKWNTFPCRDRHCPRHWKTCALDRMKALQNRRIHRLNWWHIRLLCHVPAPQGRHYFFEDFLTDLKASHDITQLLWAKHHTRKYLHIHLAMGLESTTIDADAIRAAWEAHYPASDWRAYKAVCCAVKRHFHPVDLIRYFFFGRIAKPRKTPPWGSLRGCVARWTVIRSNQAV